MLPKEVLGLFRRFNILEYKRSFLYVLSCLSCQSCGAPLPGHWSVSSEVPAAGRFLLTGSLGREQLQND